MIDALRSPPSVIVLLVLLFVSLLSQAWLYRQLRQRRQQLRALRQTVTALDAGRQQAEQANRLKSQFLGHIGHEIRTPLQAFIGLLELVLRRTQAHSQNHASLELALGAAEDLRELLGNLLDISRIESGQLHLNPTWTGLRGSVDAVLGVFQALARQKNLDLSLEFEAPTPEPRVLIDALRFKQVLANLLSNAIKFTHQGSVLVRLQLRPTARAQYFDLHLQVLDTGIGIPEQERHRLLQPFAQVDPASQSARDSSGLGLPISHRLCQEMGGSLSLHGRTGQGSEVRVGLTLTGREGLAPVKAASVPPATHPPLDMLLDVLLADDHPASLTLLRGQLEYLGHRVTCAKDGLQAYEQWKTGDFDLLIVDCNMPSMDGFQLAEAIRLSERLEQRPAVNLLGCSASNDPQTVRRCLEAGMQNCLLKPLGLNLLSRELAALRPLPRAASFNLKALHTLSRGKPLLARRLLSELLQCCREDRHLLGLIPRNDTQALLAMAHKIKGSALMVGAAPLRNSCISLEQACLDNAGIEAIRIAVHALDLALVRFSQSLYRQAHNAPALTSQTATPFTPDVTDAG